MKWRFVHSFSFMIVALLGLTAAASTQNGAAYKPDAGPYTVAVYDTLLMDGSRNREVPVKVYVPQAKKAGGKFGLIVFSHGLGGSNKGYKYLAMHWASHGYITILPTHRGTDSRTRLNGGWNALVEAAMDPRNAVLRPQDLSFVITSALSGRIRVVRGKVDPAQIGVAGHSLGAYTALGPAGQTIVQQGQKKSFRDDRVRAAIAMSTQRPGTVGLTPHSWQDIEIPVLTMTGTRDTGLGIDDVSQRRLAFDDMNRGKKYHLTIANARHAAFSDSRRRRISRDPRHHGWILQVSTAFWDAHLKNDPAALAWLERKTIEKITGGEAVLEVKTNRR